MNTITTRTAKHLTAASVAALCLASLCAAARADDTAAVVPSRTIHYSDLDLGTPAGASLLYNRIRRAAERVCGEVDSRELARAAAAKACVDRAIAASVRSVNNPRLTSVYDARTGGGRQTINVAAVR